MKSQKNVSAISWQLLTILIAVDGILALAYLFFWPSNSHLSLYLADIFIMAYTFVMAFLCFAGSPRLFARADCGARQEQSFRRFIPALLGLGMLTYSLAGLLRFIQVVVQGTMPAFPSPAHYLMFLLYPCFITAFLLFPRRNVPFSSRLHILVDCLIIMTIVVAVSHYYVLLPILTSDITAFFPKVMAVSYPLGDLALFFCLLLVIFSSLERELHAVVLVLFAAVALLFLAQSLHFYDMIVEGYQQISWINLIFLPAFALIAVAAQSVSSLLRCGKIQDDTPAPLSRYSLAPTWKTVLPYVLVLLLSSFVFLRWFFLSRGPGLDQTSEIYISIFIVVMLLVLRQFLSIYQVKHLEQDLEEKNRSLHLLNAQLEWQAISDPLTRLPNRRALTEKLALALKYASIRNKPCSLVFIDLDHFKYINDQYGHHVGDSVLCQFALLLQSSLSSDHYLGRWGGEEFVAILPGMNAQEAFDQAEKMRLSIEESPHALHGGIALTCSLGVSTYPTDALDAEGLLLQADKAMYAAKRMGRNQTRLAPEPVVLALEGIPPNFESTEVHSLVEALVGALDMRDHVTGEHSRRVGVLARQLALSMGLSDEEAYIISLAGLLHDLGKIGVPDDILFKRGRLTSYEIECIGHHPDTGADLLDTLPSLHKVAEMVRAHHEWVDGSGYPLGLKGDEIPLGARIVAVADAYDAITHTRSYRTGRPSDTGLCELRQGVGTQFDPAVVDTLLYLLSNQQPPLIVARAG